MAGKDDAGAASAADDNKQEQAPEQAQPVRGKLLSEQESHEWGQEIRIEEKQVKTEANALRNEFEQSANNQGDDAADQEDEPEEQHTPDDEAVAEPETEVTYIEDPGEFVPKDYSFEVTTFDSEGKKPKTTKVTSIEQWEELLEKEPNLGSSLAVNKAFRQAQKMESGIERDRQDWEKDKQEYDQAVENQKQVDERNTNIFNEMSYLIEKGDLPKLTAEERDKLDWSDQSVIKAHPNIKPHAELLAFMRTENAARIKAGLQPLNSALDAYNAMQLDTRRSADVAAKQRAGEARKAAGARVSSGNSTPLSAEQPKGIAVGRVGDLSRLGQNWQV